MAASPRVERFREWLRDHGQPATPQRIAIADVVFAAPETVSAEEVAQRLTARGTPAGTATIYRTLDTLVASGLVVERDFAEGFRRFEVTERRSPRVQLHCAACGAREDLREDQDLDALALRYAGLTGFEVERAHLSIHGTCAACRTAS